MAVPRPVLLCTLYAVGLFYWLMASVRIAWLIVRKRGAFFHHRDRHTAPPCLRDPVYGRHQHIVVGSVCLHYVVSGPESAPPMVLLHGLPECWYSWRHQIKHYNHKYRVYAVDLRGYGGSSKPLAVSEYTGSKLMEDIRLFIQQIAGGRKVVLVGHDWGGSITWMVAAHHPQLLRCAVVLNCPHITAFRATLQRSWKQFTKSWYMFLINFPYLPELYFMTGDLKMVDNTFCSKRMGAKKGTFSSEDIEAYKHVFNRPSDWTGPMNYIRSALRTMNTQSAAQRPVTDVPVLLLWGTLDGALSQDAAVMSKKYATDITLHLVEGASHWLQQEEPEIVNRHIDQFLEKKME